MRKPCAIYNVSHLIDKNKPFIGINNKGIYYYWTVFK